MLTKLTISNLAIIENIDVSFTDGFTVLTGATGAGKSLLIDSLSLLLGARASNELIRQGEEKAEIRGEFSLHVKRLDAILDKLDIPHDEGKIDVERSLTRSKSQVKVNGVSVSLNDLNSIAKYLASIHNQFDLEKILNPDDYLEIIDGFSYDLASSLLGDYQQALINYRTQKQQYLDLVEKQKKVDEARDFYEYQYNELKAAALVEGEQEAIASELSLLKNYDKINTLQQQAAQIIDGDSLDHLYELDSLLEELAKYQPQYQAAHDQLNDRYYELNDLLREAKRQFGETDYDPNRLNELEQRDSDLTALQRKYKKTIPELISYRDELNSLVGQGSDLSSRLSLQKKAADDAFSACFQKGRQLSLARRKIAQSIEKEIEGNLSDLLLKCRFSVSFNEPKIEDGDLSLKDNGLDQVDFLIETNVGEGLKSLSKIVSGGEASRIMLAFKALFIKANKVSTAIFDEIDTGLSGEEAAAVARKIRDISLSTQVISITHLPQVASLSDHQLLIEKKVQGGRTYASIKELDLEEKIRAVAELISGGKVTEKQLEYAKEMVLQGQND